MYASFWICSHNSTISRSVIFEFWLWCDLEADSAKGETTCSTSRGIWDSFRFTHICSYMWPLAWSVCWPRVSGPPPFQNARTKGNWDQRECGLKVQTQTFYQHTFFHGISVFCSEKQGVPSDRTIQTGINFCSWALGIKTENQMLKRQWLHEAWLSR